MKEELAGVGKRQRAKVEYGMATDPGARFVYTTTRGKTEPKAVSVGSASQLTKEGPNPRRQLRLLALGLRAELSE